MDNFFSEQVRLLDNLVPTRRYLHEHIDWNLRCIAILGARGTGKTTLMLQRIKECCGSGNRGLYVSIDSPLFQSRDLFAFAREFHQMGGETLFLDEVHKYPDWAAHLKAMFDALPKLQVVVSGSSLLRIAEEKADPSRRAIVYQLHGLSFREYLNFTHTSELSAYPLETILADHQRLAAEICRDIKILKHFRDYLQGGYYPFFLEGQAFYTFKVREVINHILEVDLPHVNRIEPRQISKIKKLLYLLSVSVPFVPNIAKLAEATDISRPKLYEYLERLQDARLLNLVRSPGRGYEILTRPDKIFLENSNLMYAVAEQVNIGSLRELFFVNQVRNAGVVQPGGVENTLECAVKGDFLVKSRFTFEVGGRGKSGEQVSGVADAYVVADDIEVGFGNKIPLWLFGFMY